MATSSTGSQGVACCICQENELKDISVLEACRLNCAHVFCFDCLCEWLLGVPKCPFKCHGIARNVKHNLQLANGERASFLSTGVEYPCFKINVAEMVEEREMQLIASGNAAHYKPEVEFVELLEELVTSYRALKDLFDNGLKVAKRGFYCFSFTSLKDIIKGYEDLLQKFKNCNLEEILTHPSFRRLVYRNRLRPSHHLRSPFAPQLVDDAYIRDNVDVFRAKLKPFITRETKTISPATSHDCDMIVERVLRFLTGEISESKVVEELERVHRFQRTDHFIFIVQDFIRTGFSTRAYDISCYYRRQSELEVETNDETEARASVSDDTTARVDVLWKDLLNFRSLFSKLYSAQMR